jgi:probable rRNA maturation factor
VEGINNNMITLNAIDNNQYNVDIDEVSLKTEIITRVLGCKVNISCIFVSESTIKEININLLSKNKVTNVISLRKRKYKNCYFGEIYLCLDFIVNEANELNNTLMEHLMHLIIHGILHILGWKHEFKHDEMKMKKKENLLMKEIGYPLPWEI